MQETVELSKKQKLKIFNEKLLIMMKNKNIDKTKLVSTVVKKQNTQNKQQIKQVKNQKQKQQNIVTQNKYQQNNQDLQKSSNEEQINQKGQKTKIIKKNKDKKSQKQISLRKAAGLVWKDKSLQQWPENDYRIFCGNLGNQVTDQMLNTVFKMKYHSCQMAKVVKDKRTGKTRGYGFISFKDPKDFLNALKQMNGKYIGNRPVKITKSNWKDRALDSDKNKYLPSDFKTNSDKQTNKICSNFKYTSPF